MSDPTDAFWQSAFTSTPAATVGAGAAALAGVPGLTSPGATTPNWSATGSIDPNTGLPTQQASSTTTPNLGLETFQDEWAKDPSGTAPVRTWIDPSLHGTEQGQFANAWYDTPLDSGGRAPTAPAATPLTGLIAALNTAAPVAAKASPGQGGGYYVNDPTSGDGTGGGSAGAGGDGNDGSSGVGGGVGGSGNSAGDGNSGDGGNGTSGDGSGTGGDSGSA